MARPPRLSASVLPRCLVYAGLLLSARPCSPLRCRRRPEQPTDRLVNPAGGLYITERDSAAQRAGERVNQRRSRRRVGRRELSTHAPGSPAGPTLSLRLRGAANPSSLPDRERPRGEDGHRSALLTVDGAARQGDRIRRSLPADDRRDVARARASSTPAIQQTGHLHGDAVLQVGDPTSVVMNGVLAAQPELRLPRMPGGRPTPPPAVSRVPGSRRHQAARRGTRRRGGHGARRADPRA